MNKRELAFGAIGAVAGAAITGIGASFKIKRLNKAVKARESAIKDIGEDLKAEMKNAEGYKNVFEMEEFKVSTLDDDLREANDKIKKLEAELDKLKTISKMKENIKSQEPAKRGRKPREQTSTTFETSDESDSEPLKGTVEDILKAKDKK